MSITVTPHLNFRGQAREALEFYRTVFGGQLFIVTNDDAHSTERPEEAAQVKFGQVTAENGFSIMAYDVPASRDYDQGVNSLFVSVRTPSAEETTALWNKLVEGSTVIEAFGPSFFSPAYGMLRDAFGVVWVLDVAVEYTG
ncbi:VOC family protein [Herbiconiux moechotypicola]|uniref:VOC family protein n=1 Tax=Herbiconiux moechotypicola TaxID=637393 RepID=A0ABN3D9H3_9MICO|nr:VOC family protein [Herbiconiux moechotypicola]MCS5728154.1 VOC family protein [Herbiconiux moechotypicola]